MTGDIERVRDALNFVPAGDRDTWVKMGMAVKCELGDAGFDVWESWSQQADSFNAKDARNVWKSIRGNGKLTAGTLFHEAKAHGWRDDGTHQRPTPKELAERRRIAAERAAKEEAKIAREYAKAAKKATAIWKAAQSAPDDHPYLARKKVKAHGLKLYRGNLEIAGMRCDGALILRMRAAKGSEPHSLQFIAPEGDKRFLPGARVQGCYFGISKATPADVLCIAEGFATAASIHEATGYPFAVAFDAGNLLPVALALREKYPAVRLIVCADDDYRTEGNPGIAKATETARAVGGVLAVPDFGTARPEGATDFNDLAAHGGPAAVRACIEAAAVPQGDDPGAAIPIPSDVSPNATVGDSASRDPDDDAIERLATLSPLDYDRVRISEAEKLGVRSATLDEQVKRARGEGDGIEAGIVFPDIEPWTEPVNGAALLDALAGACRRFIVLPKYADTGLALWIMSTHLIESAEVAPILAIMSPEKRCGKTTLVDLLLRLVAKAMPASNISAAALFRSVEKWGPTLLVDEADSFFKDNDELRGILNSGHTRSTAYVIRTVGDDHEPTKFCTWGAKAIALIGRLPDTLHDRSIVIELRRKLQGERVEKLRDAEPGKFEILARKCVRFATDNAAKIKASRPAIPDELHDRAADNWEPLLAIADAAGRKWPELAREAASTLSGATVDGDSTKTELLRDIQGALKGHLAGRDHIGSSELIEVLTADPEARWREFNHGKPISARTLARLLRPFGIVSGTVRLDSGTAKGYRVESFADAFNRYLPASYPSQRHKAVSARIVTESASVTPDALLRIANPSHANIGAGCDGVTDRIPHSGAEDGSEVF